ncbi:MAG: response regulator [Halobacteriovoraceae bacterium]|nr:response regulator [Halobacteriovoraceae bacterium]
MESQKNYKNIEILLVEDEEADVSIIKRTFRKSQIVNDLHVAKSVNEAREFLSNRNHDHPDLILLDINMPGEKGTALLKEIKTDSELKNIPVIMLSSSELSEDLRTSYLNGANCYVKKPVNLEDLVNAIKQIETFWFQIVTLIS